MHPSQSKILHTNIFQLDVLRGLAVLLVMCFHFFENFSFGWVGVDLFFVLSGFLITGKLVESMDSPKYLSAFYLKRILRIVPLFYLVLIFFFLVLPIVGSSYMSGSMRSLLQEQLYYWTFTVNFREAVKGWPVNISIIHFWSLACEMQFYLVWPFIIMWISGNSKKRKWILWLFIVVALIFRCFLADYFSLHLVSKYVLLCSRIDAFALGAMAYYFLTSVSAPRKKLPLLISVCSFVIILLLCICFKLNWHYTNEPVQWVGYTLNAVCWSGLLVWYCQLSSKSILITRVLAIVGKYSYAMYVFHLPLWIFLQKFLETYPSPVPSIWIKVSAFIITFLLAFLSYHLYEKHFLRMKPVLRHA